MFKPHVTATCTVHVEDKFLAVEGTIDGKTLWNQPTRHLGADETLAQAVARRLWEGTGTKAQPQRFIRIHQWVVPGRAPLLCFLFSIEPAGIYAIEPCDSDISCRRWVSTEEIFSVPNLCSPLVAENIRCYQNGQRYPLAMIGKLNWSFTEGAK